MKTDRLFPKDQFQGLVFNAIFKLPSYLDKSYRPCGRVVERYSTIHIKRQSRTTGENYRF